MFKLIWAANGLKPLKKLEKYMSLKKLASVSFALSAAALLQTQATSGCTVTAERRSCNANEELHS